MSSHSRAVSSPTGADTALLLSSASIHTPKINAKTSILSALIHKAVQESDRVAHANSIHHIYMGANLAVSESLRYFAQDISTPTTVFDTLRCLILPSQQVGPVVYLVAPYSPLAEILLHQYAQATLISQPAHVGGTISPLYSFGQANDAAHTASLYT